MGKFEIKGYNSYSGCDIVVTARLNVITGAKKEMKEKVYTLGSLQTLSVSTHQDKQPVRVIGSTNALDYVMGQRTIAGSLVFAVFDQHFATEMFNDLEESTGKTFFLPDELPALDITITFANEYGKKSRMAIYGLRIINEGQVMSINDLYTENTYQFVATAMEPLKKGVQGGTSSSSNKSEHIVPYSGDNNDKNKNKGENIYNRNLATNLFTLRRVTLTAIVEQPTNKEQEGIVKLYLSPNQKTGTISILNKKNNEIIKEIQMINHMRQYIVYLKPGEYSAWYQDKGQTLSNTVNFIINNSYVFDTIVDDTPIIESVTYNSISVLSNNPSHDTCVCIDVSTRKTYEQEIKSRMAYFKALKENTNYLIYTKLKDKYSKTVQVKTLKNKNELLNGFKDYVKYNSLLLSKDFDEYTDILNKLKDDHFLTALEKEKDLKAKELMFMGVKYKNEFTSTLNSSNCESMPTKKINNMFGNTFKFNAGVSKANIFINRNKKDYYEATESYPTEVTYTGKPNTLYNVVGVNNNFVKSPKYTFYSFSDNDKHNLKNIYGNVDVLNSYELQYPINSKLSELSLKCLNAKENKNKDINLLKAPGGYIDNSLNLIADIDYTDILGKKNKDYYLCVSKLNECLDSTPFRKIKINDSDNHILVGKYSTAINNNDVFVLWIEDEDYNVVSELGFVSSLEDTNNLNDYLIKQDGSLILKKIENNIDKTGYLSELVSYLSSNNMYSKNIYKELAQLLVSNREDHYHLIYELFKIMFSDICVNREKYRKAIYNKKTKNISFDNAENAELIQIGIKKDEYTVFHFNTNNAFVNDMYDINIFYLINQNPVIKSGFVIIDNNNAKSFYINLEVTNND